MDGTDWDCYYSRPFPAAAITRRITTTSLIRQIRRFLGDARPAIVELGGGNSCFVDALYAALAPVSYTVMDNNRLGLSLLARRRHDRPGLVLMEDDVLTPRCRATADLVFSVGLIEHFDPTGTRAAIDAHYRYARPGGLVVIGFPTPTWLYRATRNLAESLHLWRFPDERPLAFHEVREAMGAHGEILGEDLVWPIILTQGLLAGRKRS